MKEDLIADIWTMMVEHIGEKSRADVASDFVNLLMDYGIKESILDNLLGVDPYLDEAIEYVIDGEEIEEEYEDEYDDEE